LIFKRLKAHAREKKRRKKTTPSLSNRHESDHMYYPSAALSLDTSDDNVVGSYWTLYGSPRTTRSSWGRPHADM